MLLPLVLWGLLASVEVHVRGPGVDADLVREGIELRLGEVADAWTVEVTTDGVGTEIDVNLSPPGGAVVHRTLSVDPGTSEERSRELALAVCLIIEAYRPPPAAVVETRDPGPRESSTSVWSSLNGTLSYGDRDDPVGGGLSLRVGARLVDEHVVPTLEIGWIHSGRDDLDVDGLRLGGGVGAGAGMGEHWWVGGAALARAQWTTARAQRRAGAWSSNTFVGAWVHARKRPWLGDLLVGVELQLPALRFLGNDTSYRWGVARFAITWAVGRWGTPSRS